MIRINVLDETVDCANVEEATQYAITAASSASRIVEGVYPNVARVGHAVLKASHEVTGTPDSWANVVKAHFSAQEKIWKKQQQDAGKADALPNAWVSAKSVVLGAIKLGLELVDESGEPIGKTAMQKAIKAAKGGDLSGDLSGEVDGEGEESPKDPKSALYGTLPTIAKYYVLCSYDDRQAFIDQINAICMVTDSE